MDREALRQTLLEMLEEEKWEKFEGLDESSNLRTDLHLDSVDLVSLVLQIERKFNVDIDSKDLEKIATVGDVLNFVEAHQGTAKVSQAA